MSVCRVAFWIFVCLFGSGIASASTLTLSFEVTLRQSVVGSPGDPAGMDGATVSFSATFVDGATWQDSGFGSVFAVAGSHSFTIAGASVAASNGTYSDPGGLVIESAAGFESRFFSLPGTFSDSPEILLGSGHSFGLGFALSPVSVALQPSIGDLIDVSHFAASFAFDQDIYDSSSPTANLYVVDTVVAAPNATGGGPTNPNIPTVPIPLTLPMLAMSFGLLGLLWRSKRRLEAVLT